MHRAVAGTDPDVTTETLHYAIPGLDILIGQVEQLEPFHWNVGAHLEDQGGQLQTSGAATEAGAARAAHD